MSRLLLICFIILGSVLASENAFSMRWKEAYREAILHEDRSITLKVLIWSYINEGKSERVFYNSIVDLKISYTEDGKKFIPLLNTSTDLVGNEDHVWVKILFKKIYDQVVFPNAESITSNNMVKLRTLKTKYTKSALFEVNWVPYKTIKPIQSVRIEGKWGESVNGKKEFTSFRETLKLKVVKSAKNSPEKNRSTQETLEESNNNVKVTVNADIISVTGVNSGENIKVYNYNLKTQVKSVIAHDKVVNIQLTKGQIYFVQVGQTSIKVAL